MRKFWNRGKIILTLSMICLLLAAVIVGVGVKVFSIGGTGTKTLSSRSSGTLPPYPNFKGLFQFTASNTSKNSDKPYLAGTHLGYYWSQLEPQKGQYDWNIIDQGMKPWTDHGKKVILRVSTAGWTRWAPPYSGNGTPQWVYKLGVSSVTEIDHSVLPQYWNPIFLQNLSDFVHALALRYDGNPDIAYIDIGLGVGGESKVDSQNSNPDQLKLWQRIGYTDPLWWDAVRYIITAYTSSFSKTPLAVMPDKTFIARTKGYNEALLLNYAVKLGLWLQDNGLSAGRQLSPSFMAVPHPAEQSQAAGLSGDTLQSDIQRALDLGANYILVFSNDLNNPANLRTLQWVAAKVAIH